MENTAFINEICGANDANLRCMEDLLGVRILSRGNELLLEDGGKPTRDLFLRMIDAIKERINSGLTPVPELIRSIYDTITGNDSDAEARIESNRIDISVSDTTIYPRNISQVLYLNALRRYNLLFCIGPAGTGKTFLAVVYAVQQLFMHRVRRIVLTRPVVEAGERLGFLPGDMVQKLHPYMRPLYDAMDLVLSAEVLQRLEERHLIEIAPLAYMRGRSLNECIIILDESQNTTKEQMKMFLTRLGSSSQMIVTGDITQIDLPNDTASGLLHARRILSSTLGIGFHYFGVDDIVRNPLIQRIVEAYEQDKGID